MKNKSFPGISNFFFLFLLGWSLVPASAQPSCATPPTGLVDWWPGEGNGVDVVTGGAGTPYPGTGFTNGVVGQAFSFDGITGCVMNTNTPGLTNIQNSFTFEFWAYPQKSFVLVGEGATNANGNFGQSYAIFPEWAGDDGAGAYKVTLDGSGPEQLGQWHKAGDVFVREKGADETQDVWENLEGK